jgi:hypothetical protein
VTSVLSQSGSPLRPNIVRQRSDTLVVMHPPPLMRRAVSFDPSRPLPLARARVPSTAQRPPSAVFSHGHHPTLSQSSSNRFSRTSAYYSAKSRPSTAGTTWSKEDSSWSPVALDEGDRRDKPLPLLPTPTVEDMSVIADKTTIGDESQDDSGVFVGDISTVPILNLEL